MEERGEFPGVCERLWREGMFGMGLLRVDSSSSVHYWQWQGFGLVFLSLLDVDVLPCLLIAGFAEKWKICCSRKWQKVCAALTPYRTILWAPLGIPGVPALFPSLTLVFPSELIFLLAVASMFFGFFFFLMRCLAVSTRTCRYRVCEGGRGSPEQHTRQFGTKKFQKMEQSLMRF